MINKIFIIVLLIVTSSSMAAQIPPAADNVSGSGFTRIDFCYGDESLYAFNGLNLYRYEPGLDAFIVIFAGAGAGFTWDPADFAFVTDFNDAILPTGLSSKVIYADIVGQTAEEKINLTRNYYSIASRFRADQIFANGVDAASNNTVYMLKMAGDGNETELVQVSNRNSGAIGFDAADNLYLADFKPMYDGSGLGNVNIHRISRGQIDTFVQDSNFTVVPEIIVNDVVLAGSDSIVIDSDYNIYIGSYVGVAKIIPTNEPNDFNVIEIDGDIYANPYGFPKPQWRFCGIAADIINGVMYYGKSEFDSGMIPPGYGDYELQTFAVESMSNWSADLDGDGIVDYYDIMLMTEDYLLQGEYIRGDINRDGIVDLKDFAVLAKQWGQTARWY
ncbi:MAG: hypothetical protein JW806_03400 [Sedimentisphaerales bacterium]|nr:hypothetical protein [Sedimentisphaerales bacterium]